MLDLYIQIAVALLLAFLLGFLIAKMWVQNRQNEYLAKLLQLETKLNSEEEFKQQQIHKISLLQEREQQLKGEMDGLTSIKTSLSIEISSLNKNLENKQIEVVEAIDNKEKVKEQLVIKSTQNYELTTNLHLATEQQSSLNLQLQTLSENHQHTLKTIEFMEEQTSTFAIQQGQLQQSLHQSTQHYESMDGQINTLTMNEKQALEEIHELEKKYLDVKTKSQFIEEEKINYCDKLSSVNQQQIQLKAHTLVRNHTLGAISVAIIPVPLFDLVALLSIQIKMLRALAEKYQLPFSENKVKSLVLPLLSSTLTITGTLVFSSFIKIIPGIGQASGIVSFSVLAGTATYTVGEIFIEHFESGGTFLDFNVENQKARFRELYEKGKQIKFG